MLLLLRGRKIPHPVEKQGGRREEVLCPSHWPWALSRASRERRVSLEPSRAGTLPHQGVLQAGVLLLELL